MSVKLPDRFIEECRAYVASGDNNFRSFAVYLADAWEEMGEAFTHEATKAEGWDRDQDRRGHRLWVNQIAAHVGLGEQSVYDYKRIGINIIKRGLWGGENENLTSQHWLAILRNAEKDDTDKIALSVIEERLAWVHQIADANQGQPPSVRDMNKQFRQNGEKKEWELCWKNIRNNAKAITEINGLVPEYLMKIAEWLLSIVDVASTGGTSQEK